MIRPAETRDGAELHSLTQALLEHHVNQGAKTRLSREGRVELQKEGFLKVIVLTTPRTGSGKPSKTARRVVGYATFVPDFDMLFGRHGIMLDQFFIREEFRRQGQGRRLLSAVVQEARKQSARYVKLYYQQALKLEGFYAHFGFANWTKAPPHTHIWEVYGPEDLNRCFGEAMVQASRFRQS